MAAAHALHETSNVLLISLVVPIEVRVFAALRDDYAGAGQASLKMAEVGLVNIVVPIEIRRR